MPDTILSPGDPIQARCTKCKQNTDSIIVSLSENLPEKVQCGICSRKHKYRPPIEEKKKAAPARGSLKVETERKRWAALFAKADRAKATEYSMTASFKLNSVIDHPVFGLGFVQCPAGSQKVEILFETGTKTMRCK